MKRVLIVQEKLQELTSVVKQTKNKVCTVRERAEGGDSGQRKVGLNIRWVNAQNSQRPKNIVKPTNPPNNKWTSEFSRLFSKEEPYMTSKSTKKFSFLRDQWMEIKASLLVRLINIQLNKNESKTQRMLTTL